MLERERMERERRRGGEGRGGEGRGRERESGALESAPDMPTVEGETRLDGFLLQKRERKGEGEGEGEGEGGERERRRKYRTRNYLGLQFPTANVVRCHNQLLLGYQHGIHL